MRTYGAGAKDVEDLVNRALADNPTEEAKAALADILRFESSKSLAAQYISEAAEEKPQQESDEARDSETVPHSGENALDTKAGQEPKPIGRGSLGNIYNQFAGKVKEAFKFLAKAKDGLLLNVWHRDDIGDISLAWGEARTAHTGKGLAHIIKKHIEALSDFKDIDEAERVIDDVITNGVATKDGKGTNVNIDKDGYRVVIAKDDNGNWVLTAFDASRSIKQKKKGAATTGTPGQPAVAEGAGAVAPNLSDRKVTQSSGNKQEKLGENIIRNVWEAFLNSLHDIFY